MLQGAVNGFSYVKELLDVDFLYSFSYVKEQLDVVFLCREFFGFL